MKCRIDIKEKLISDVVEKYETRNITRINKNTLFISNTAFPSGTRQAYMIADNLVNRINKEYQGLIAHHEQSSNGQEIIISPSNNLISVYYDAYLKAFTEDEARRIQMEDAKRAGVEYTDDYLFESDAYFDWEKSLLESTSTPVPQNIFEELANLNFTNEVIEYLYNDSSKRLSLQKFGETVKMFAINLRGMGYNNEEILENIKCL